MQPDVCYLVIAKCTQHKETGIGVIGLAKNVHIISPMTCLVLGAGCANR